MEAFSFMLKRHILMHDCWNMKYSGAKAAVAQYCSGNEVPYFVLSDATGVP